MKYLYFFEDVDGIEVEVEEDLNVMEYNALLLRKLIEHGTQDEFSNFLVYHMFVSVNSLIDLLRGLNGGLHFKLVSDEQAALIRSM